MDSFNIFGRNLNPTLGSQGFASQPNPGSSQSPFFMPNTTPNYTMPLANGMTENFAGEGVMAPQALGAPHLQNQLNASAAKLSSQMPMAVATARNTQQQTTAQMNPLSM